METAGLPQVSAVKQHARWPTRFVIAGSYFGVHRSTNTHQYEQSECNHPSCSSGQLVTHMISLLFAGQRPTRSTPRPLCLTLSKRHQPLPLIIY
jgi:hypothetical protein